MKSVGIDIIEIDRVSLEPRFVKRWLTDNEWKKFQALGTEFKKKQFFAGRWALKEALFKALPNEHLAFDKIDIQENKNRQPSVKIKDYHISLSLSHNCTNVVAIAICF